MFEIRTDVLGEKHSNASRGLSNLGCTLRWQEIFAVTRMSYQQAWRSEEGRTEQQIP